MAGYLLSTVRLPPTTHSALRKAGYISSDDLAGVSADSLSKELGISLAQAGEVLQPVEPTRTVLPKSASASTLLGNGAVFYVLPSLPFLPSSLIEICGPPGSGKTRIALSVLRRVIETGDEAMVADMDGSFRPSRLSRLSRTWEQTNKAASGSMGKRVHVTSLSTLTALLSLLQSFPTLSAKYPKIKLLVLDGLAVPFRHPAVLPPQRHHALSTIRDALQRISALPIAVIFTSHAATKLVNFSSSLLSISDDNLARAIIQPALGDTWMSGRFARVMLAREGVEGERIAYVTRDGRTDRVQLDFNRDDITRVI